MEISQVTERKHFNPEVKATIMGAIDIAAQSPDFSLHAQYLTGKKEEADQLLQHAVYQFEQVIDSDPDFIEWAYGENEKLDGKRYPFHRGSYHPYEIALYQSMLLAYFTRENGPLEQLSQEIKDEIIYSGITHEIGMVEGRTQHEARGAQKVTEKSPNTPIRALGITTTTLIVTHVTDAHDKPHNALVQQEVWNHEQALQKLDQALQQYNLPTPLTQEQKELLLGIMAYPDIKGLLIPSSTTETGVIASALENILTSGDQTAQEQMVTFDKAVSGTALIVDGLHASMRISPIYRRLLQNFKVPGSSEGRIYTFIRENQPFYNNFFRSIQESMPPIPAPTESDPEATRPGIPSWYPYLDRTIQQYKEAELTQISVYESSVWVNQLYNVIKFSMAFEHLIDSIADEKRTAAEDLYLQFLGYLSNPSLSFSDIEQSYFDCLNQALELSSSQTLSL